MTVYSLNLAQWRAPHTMFTTIFNILLKSCFIYIAFDWYLFFDSQLSIEVVELDPSISEIANSWFEFKEDDRMQVIIEDGLKYIRSKGLFSDLKLFRTHTLPKRGPQDVYAIDEDIMKLEYWRLSHDIVPFDVASSRRDKLRGAAEKGLQFCSGRGATRPKSTPLFHSSAAIALFTMSCVPFRQLKAWNKLPTIRMAFRLPTANL